MTVRFLVLLLVVPWFAACGGGATTPAAGSPDVGTSVAADAAQLSSFPVTISHRFGETVVESAPQRIVSVGFNDHDTILALGAVPVAAREWYGDFPNATWEWAQDELGDQEMAVLSSEELDFERIAELDPDLIVGIFSGMTETDYELLSQIAPTIAAPEEFPDFGTPWREVTRIYGQALGEIERAEGIIAELDARFAAVRKAHPEFGGAEAVVAFFSGGEIGAYVSADLRSRLLADVGFAIPTEIDEAGGEGAFFAPLSLEQADLIDRDVVVWVTATPEEIEELRNLAVRRTLDIAEEGREVFTDFTLNGAFSFSSPLSIPYLLDSLVPQLAAAVDGDPQTEVEGAS